MLSLRCCRQLAPRESSRLIVLALVLAGIAACATPPAAPVINVGDVWRYQARAGEQASTITVLKSEPVYDIDVVMVRVDAIMLTDPEGRTVRSWPFLPFQRRVLEDSLVEKVGVVESVPDFSDQYQAWVAAGDRRWVWRQSVAHALDGLQDSYDRLRASADKAARKK